MTRNAKRYQRSSRASKTKRERVSRKKLAPCTKPNQQDSSATLLSELKEQLCRTWLLFYVRTRRIYICMRAYVYVHIVYRLYIIHSQSRSKLTFTLRPDTVSRIFTRSFSFLVFFSFFFRSTLRFYYFFFCTFLSPVFCYLSVCLTVFFFFFLCLSTRSLDAAIQIVIYFQLANRD